MACTDGSNATRARVGSTVRRAGPADVSQPTAAEATRRAGQPRPCATRQPAKRKVPSALAGRTARVWVEGLDSRVKFNRIVICLSGET